MILDVFWLAIPRMRYFIVLYITIMSSYMLLSCNCNANVITYPCVWLILWYAKVSYLSFIASIKIRKNPIFLRLPCSLHVFIALLFCKNRLVYPSIVLKMEKSSLFFMQPCIVDPLPSYFIKGLMLKHLFLIRTLRLNGQSKYTFLRLCIWSQ